MTTLDTVRFSIIAFFVGLSGLLFEELNYLNVKYEIASNQFDVYRHTVNSKMTDLQRQLISSSFFEEEAKCLADNLYFEAANEGREGMLAVATVTMNRVANNSYPKTICQVVNQTNPKGCQFSWTCDGKSDKVFNNTAYHLAMKLSNAVILKDLRSAFIPEDALYYHADYIEPEWSKQKKKIIKVGRHIFYKE